MNVTPAEFLSVGLNQNYTTLRRIYILVKDLVFPPPYDMFKQIFEHCVVVHKRWTIDLLKEHIKNPDRFNTYIQLLVLQAESVDVDLVLEKFYTFKLNQLLEVYTNKIIDQPIWSESVEEQISQFASNLTKLVQSKKDDSIPVNGLDLLKISEDELSKVYLPLKFGFDEDMQGGVHSGELCIFMAPTNGGKTSLLIRAACIALSMGFSVYYASLEMGLDVMSQRIKTALEALHLKTDILERLYVKQYPSKRATIDEIFLDVDSLNIDVVILDYLDLVKLYRSQQVWLDLEEAIAYFRGLVVERRQIALTASQVNREGIRDSGKTLIDLDKIAGSVGKAFTADYIVTINPPSDNSTITHVFLAKNRRGPKKLQSVDMNLTTLTVDPILVDFLPK